MYIAFVFVYVYACLFVFICLYQGEQSETGVKFLVCVHIPGNKSDSDSDI